MLVDRHHFHFFGNKEVNSLALTLALFHFGEGLLNVFVPIYFWTLGFPIWKIIFFFFLNSLFSIILTFAVLRFVVRLSDKMMMFLSVPFLAFYYLGLNYIVALPWLFYALPAILALNMLLFSVGYNLDFAESVDDGNIGKEIGQRFMIGSLVQFSAPFIGGTLIALTGFEHTFAFGVTVLCLAFIPLFFFPPRKFSQNINNQSVLGFLNNGKMKNFNISAVGYATETMVDRIIWPLFVFLIVGSIQNFGGLISAGWLLSGIITFLVGYLSDSKRRKKILSATTSIFSLSWILRAFSIEALMVAGSHIIGNIAHASLTVAWTSEYYKLARAVNNPGAFILSREILYNITRIVFLPILMAFAYFLPIEIFFRISFLFAALLTLLFVFANRVNRPTA